MGSYAWQVALVKLQERIVESWRNIFVTIVFMTITTVCCGLSVQDSERFDRAGELYKQDKVEEAYLLYKEISQPTARVYFNMGNCAFKLKKFGHALWHWRQAECRWGLFDRDDLYQNLDIIQNKLQASKGKPVAKVSKKFFERFSGVVHAIPLWVIQFFFLIGWTLLFVFVKSLLKKKKRGLLLMLFSWLVVFGGLLMYNQAYVLHPRAIVIESGVTLYSGPSTTYQKIGVLPEGCEVRVDKQRQDFCKIKKKNLTGWVVRNSLGFI